MDSSRRHGISKCYAYKGLDYQDKSNWRGGLVTYNVVGIAVGTGRDGRVDGVGVSAGAG